MGGCATVGSLAPVPPRLADTSQIANMPGIRTWGDDGAEAVAAFLATEAAAIKLRYAERMRNGRPLESHILALSGGGDDGVFGAGFLTGWSAKGSRPTFDLVTGISAGSLVAPFVFLGPSYDASMARIFLGHSGEDIFQSTVLSGLFGGPSMADNAPLAKLIAQYVDQRMVARIAEERAKGRILLIGTTNLMAQRPVFWDMGRIAQVGTPEALDLFHKVMLASTAIPGVFPPVQLPVTADGKVYYEMHVDGGTTREVFLSPTALSFRRIDAMVGRRVQRHLWVIRNGKIGPEYAYVEESAMAIAARSLTTLTKSQGIGDLIRMYIKAKAEGIDFNLVSVPEDFSHPHPAPFDGAYMKALYARGNAVGRTVNPWVKAPPDVPMLASR